MAKLPDKTSLLKIYIYPNSDQPYDTDPSSKEALFLDTLFSPKCDPPHFIAVNSPDEADFITCSLRLHDLLSQGINHEESINNCLKKIAQLPYINLPQYQDKHFFLSGHCLFPALYLGASQVFQTSVSTLDKKDNIHALPLHSLDYGEYQDKTPKLNCSFIGALTHPVRHRLIEKFSNLSQSKIKATDKFFWEMNQEEQNIQRQEFIDTCSGSRFILCPRGYGESSFRLFEAMSFGRIPILISDTVALPYEDIIDYDQFIYRVGESDEELSKIHAILQLPEEQYQKRAQLARETWVKHLKKEHIPREVCQQLRRIKNLKKEKFKIIKPLVNTQVSQNCDSPVKIWDKLQKMLDKDCRFALFGAGQFTQRLLNNVSFEQVKPLLIFDDNYELEKTICGIKVCKAEEGYNDSFDVLFLATDSHEEAFILRAQLLFPEKRIITFSQLSNPSITV